MAGLGRVTAGRPAKRLREHVGESEWGLRAECSSGDEGKGTHLRDTGKMELSGRADGANVGAVGRKNQRRPRIRV